MLQGPKRFYQHIKERIFRKSLSLAEKCRLQFGGAVLFSLVLALLISYFWMNKLTEKSALDSGRAIGQVFYENHFKIGTSENRPPLSESGIVLNDPNHLVQWVRLDKDTEQIPSGLSETEMENLKLVRNSDTISDVAWTERSPQAGTQNHYLRLVRAQENCLHCHTEEGLPPAFSKNQEVGVLVAATPAATLAWTLFMNRLWVVVAGLLAATGAMVSFYTIVQRVILRPIRQLRAQVNNIADGNYDIRSSIKTGDEYERLSDAFNHMLDNLMESQHKLEQANKRLDAKISQLSEKNIELFKANKIKSEFLANMSHEFRTPLNAILGFAELLREKPASDIEKSKRWAENIVSSGRSLLNMINDLLDLAKTESAKMEIHIDKTSIPRLLDGLTAFFSPLTEQKTIKVRLDVADNIPLIDTDPQKVQQILYNLLSNAIKFTPEGGRVQIAAAMRDDTTVRISIMDTGPGISHEDQERIFDKFYQLDGSITRKSEGTGLGLAICKQLADLLVASIHLESTPGEGAIFSLDLPVNLKVSKDSEDEAPEHVES
ncbi:MAG: HAMP domain-containing histidine kinase [Planctomycetes bacterium]|nr:HAMP domain-containing histidine kinase [Planctomycetota bacterium]